MQIYNQRLTVRLSTPQKLAYQANNVEVLAQLRKILDLKAQEDEGI